MRPYFSCYLLIPIILSILYGCTQYRSVTAMGGTALWARINLILTALSGFTLVFSWAVWGYPLPVFYILAYLFWAARLAGRTPDHRSWFVLNLSYTNTMSLHLALIGAGALFTGNSMHTFLADGFWRTMSAVAVLAANIVEDLLFQRRPALPATLAAEAGSIEARPFMAFLWFSTGYLLVDSFLCVVELEPFYPPLFLVGSIAVLMYFVIRFLLHINAIIRDEHLKEEHDRLSLRLEAAQENAGMLKRLVDRDALTGAFSRRHILGHMTGLIECGEPFSLAFLDLDGLKQLNDNEGHDAGDHYLIGFTHAVEAHLRENDLLARVGGDEFLVLMPSCDAAAAAQRIEEIRSLLETQRQGGTIFRFSFGIAASSPGDGHDAQALLQNADRAMYQDKKQR